MHKLLKVLNKNKYVIVWFTPTGDAGKQQEKFIGVRMPKKIPTGHFIDFF